MTILIDDKDIIEKNGERYIEISEGVFALIIDDVEEYQEDKELH